MYSYYPLSSTEYKKLDNFSNYFCRYIDTANHKGWLDINGRAYSDK